MGAAEGPRAGHTGAKIKPHDSRGRELILIFNCTKMKRQNMK